MLDVGGGSGAFSYVFADKHPNLTSLILELPEVNSAAQHRRRPGIEGGPK
jgi:hypothetical protein